MPRAGSLTTSGMAQGQHHNHHIHVNNSNNTASDHPIIKDPAQPQYTTKFSASNNVKNVKINNATEVTSTSAWTNISHPNGVIANASTSTTTAFYSGVKLAPPVQSASVEAMERRASDQKTWYTIQVCPCHLIIPGSNGATIPRKPYRIYRRYEDVADFADQLDEELPALLLKMNNNVLVSNLGTSALSGVHLETTQESLSSSALSATSTNCSAPASFPSPLCLTSGPMANTNSSYTMHSTTSIAIANTDSNILNNAAKIPLHAVPTTYIPYLTFPALYYNTSGASTTNSEREMVQCTSHSSGQVNVATSFPATAAGTVSLPKLKSRLVLFVTKAVCVQRKEELDRYLHDLFGLGPIIAQSRLVAEFFGIWKTDMEMHLSHENRDPLALHAGLCTRGESGGEGEEGAGLTLASSLSPSLPLVSQPPNVSTLATMPQQRPDDQRQEQEHQQESQQENQQENLQQNQRQEGKPVQEQQKQDLLLHSATAPFSPSSPTDILRQTLDTDTRPPSPTLDMPPSKPTLVHLASPVGSPPVTPTSHPESLKLIISNIAENLSACSDIEMVSPTEPLPSPVAIAPMSCPMGDNNESVNDASANSTTMTESETCNSTTSNNGTVSVTTRIKRFRSLRRANTAASSSSAVSQPDQQQQQQRSPGPDETNASTQRLQHRHHGAASPRAGRTSTATSPSGPGQLVGGNVIKPKIMKRAKTIVFRPEVTMQPLSSKNVIPPWNRIPSTMTPISPVSPTSPTSLLPMAHELPISGGDRNSSTCNDTTQMSGQCEERPRKLSMVHSKTMTASISSQSSQSSQSSHSSAASTGHLGSSLSAVSSSTASPVSSSTAFVPTSPGLQVAACADVVAGDGRGGGEGGGGGAMGTFRARGGSVSSTMSTVSSTTTLVAPWNRANSKSENNTCLHSLIKISGQLSPSAQSPASSSPFVPVEISKSVQKKQQQKQQHQGGMMTTSKGFPGRGLSKSATVPANLKDYQQQEYQQRQLQQQQQQQQTIEFHQSLKNGTVPVLTQPPLSRCRTSSGSRVKSSNSLVENNGYWKGDMTKPRSQSVADTATVAPPLSPLSPSTSSNAVVVPTMTISAPPPETTMPATESTVGTAKKRRPQQQQQQQPHSASSRRERGSLHSPSMSTKKPVGILKNAGAGLRKASLTVPSLTGMFPTPSLSSPLPSPSLSSQGHLPSRGGTPTPSSAGSVMSNATTFKIVMDADTIVALQVPEDASTLQGLRARIETKLLKSNIQLPDAYDLVWKAGSGGVNASSTTSSKVTTSFSTTVATATGSLPSPGTPSTTTSMKTIMMTMFSEQPLTLKSDQHLQQAIQGSKGRKVTLHCVV
ncbi:hypothetical protein BGZ94_005920 [Podila epigama]|nr:hypothetical protein BGZ94_005920 [Podila epigama]